MTKTRSSQIPIQKPLFGSEEERAVVEVLRSGWVSQGPKVLEFEKTFAEYVGTRFAVAVTSCTTALHLALIAHGIGEGDEVICPSNTFIATPNSIRYCGATPIFADIDPATYNIDVSDIEHRITSKTKAIMPVHQVGLPADLNQIYDIASRHDLEVIEDAAPAIGAEYKGTRIGNSKGSVCFSFHPRKIISTGEGGMITTNDDRIDYHLRLYRQHCMSVNDLTRHEANQVIFEEYTDLGYNFRMTDLQAAIGIEQMKRLDHILSQRRRIAQRYNQAFAAINWLTPPFCPPDREHTYQSYVVRVKPEAPVSRDELMQTLLYEEIQTRRGAMNSHLEPAYAELAKGVSLPNSESALNETMILPLFPTMTDEEQDRVIQVILNAG
jgi:perosamine synthetase